MRSAAIFCAVVVILLACPATAADLAILSNGFSIRHDHHLVMGATTRLYLTNDDSSFTDVPTAEISSYEKDLSLPLPSPKPLPENMQVSINSQFSKPAPAPPLNQVVDSASAAYHLDPDLVNSVIHAKAASIRELFLPKALADSCS